MPARLQPCLPPLERHDQPASCAHRVLHFRRRRGLTQRQLARLMHISQATISRLEAAPMQDFPLHLLPALAHALKCDVADLVPDGMQNVICRELDIPDQHLAFCPNPFCTGNHIAQQGTTGQLYCQWRYRTYQPSEFQRLTFCPECGSRMVKQCPHCQAPLDLRQQSGNHCIACGGKLCDRPTRAESRKLYEYRLQRLEDGGELDFSDLELPKRGA